MIPELTYTGFKSGSFVIGWDHCHAKDQNNYTTQEMIINEVLFMAHIIRKYASAINAEYE